MLRKMIVLAMLTLYGASAIGVPLHYHYCMGELQHISLFTQRECDTHEKHDQEAEKSPAVCCVESESIHCNMEEGPNCCDDELDLIQLDDDFAAVLMPFSLDVEMCSVTNGIALPAVVVMNGDKGFNANATPVHATKIYLANCSFVFYG